MQQVFSDVASRSAPAPLIEFTIPESLQAGTDVHAARKRQRSPSSATSTSGGKTDPADKRVSLTRDELAALQRFLAYGDQAASAVDCLRRSTNSHRATPAEVLGSSSGATPRVAMAPSQQWCVPALRQVLSLLCRFIRLDTSAYYLGSPVSSSQVGAALTPAATTTAAGAPPQASQVKEDVESGVAAHQEPARTLELYCRFQALELEVEDVVLRSQTTAHGEGVPDAVRQQAARDVESTVRCVEAAVNALEWTLVNMLLPMASTASSKTASAATTAAEGVNGTGTAVSPPLDYVAALVRQLPDLFQSERWPAQVVCNRDSSAYAGASVGQGCGASLQDALLSSPQPDSRSSSPEISEAASRLFRFRTLVGEAVTSLALRSLFDSTAVDMLNILGVATASPISRLAALEKLKSSPRGSLLNDIAHLQPPARPALDVETLEFRDVLVRAWNHGYTLLGLQRLRFEMQALFYQLASRATAATGAGKDARPSIHELWQQWTRALAAHHAALMEKLGSPDAASGIDGAASAAIMEGDRLDSCAVLRQHAVSPARGLTSVQSSALRVVAKLQAVDSKGWFAVPAFDLVNVDFASVRYWVASPSFAHKSKREAYRSLCRVLERMVDSCVHKYGPTHAFSDVITNVRQQLVDVARAEGLL